MISISLRDRTAPEVSQRDADGVSGCSVRGVTGAASRSTRCPDSESACARHCDMAASSRPSVAKGTSNGVGSSGCGRRIQEALRADRRRASKPRNITSSFSKREKIRRKPLSRRNSRSTSIRRFRRQRKRYRRASVRGSHSARTTASSRPGKHRFASTHGIARATLLPP